MNLLTLLIIVVKYKELGVIIVGNETFFKSSIRKIDSDLNITSEEQVIYRVINFGNLYFFAQEISTGCIFPVYSFGPNGDDHTRVSFRCNSYIKNAKHFLFYPTKYIDKVFEYHFNEKFIYNNKQDFKMPSIKEVNKYLKENRNNDSWERKMKTMELENQYMCDISLIKNKISLLRSSDYSFEFEYNNPTLEHVNYKSKIDVDKIKEFGYDLSTQDNLCNLIGREEEKKKIIKAVGIRGKSVILIGESGSGKTSIPESLALDIKNKRSPWLKDKVIFYFNVTSMVSGTKYRGDFEKKFLEFINFCRENKDKIIIFIDEIHTLYGLGASDESMLDAMNILKPYITKGDLTIIGATTKNEYEQHMKKDSAFLTRFEEVIISPLNKNMNVQIILSYINELQNKYKIKFDIDENIILNIAEFIVDITDIKNQTVIGINKVINPTISKSIIDEAFAEAIYNYKNSVTLEDICNAILSCDKFSPTYKKEVVIKLKRKFSDLNKIEYNEPIKLEHKTLALVKK